MLRRCSFLTGVATAATASPTATTTTRRHASSSVHDLVFAERLQAEEELCGGNLLHVGGGALFDDYDDGEAELLYGTTTKGTVSATGLETKALAERQTPERALRVAEACLASYAGYAYAKFSVVDILHRMFTDKMLTHEAYPFTTVLPRWFRPAPVTPCCNRGALRGSMGEERGIAVEALLLRMLHEHETESLTLNGTRRAPSPLVNALRDECQLSPRDADAVPLLHLLRGIAVSTARNDAFVDIDVLSAAVIAGSDAVAAAIPPRMLLAGMDDRERAAQWVRLLLGAAAEFGSHGLALHAAEVARSRHMTLDMAHHRLLTHCAHRHVAREQDWRLRMSGSLRGAVHGWIMRFAREQEGRDLARRVERQTKKKKKKQQMQQQQQQQAQMQESGDGDATSVADDADADDASQHHQQQQQPRLLSREWHERRLFNRRRPLKETKQLEPQTLAESEARAAADVVRLRMGLRKSRKQRTRRPFVLAEPRNHDLPDSIRFGSPLQFSPKLLARREKYRTRKPRKYKRRTKPKPTTTTTTTTTQQQHQEELAVESAPPLYENIPVAKHVDDWLAF